MGYSVMIKETRYARKNNSFEQDTAGMTASNWDALVAKEGVNDPPSIEATEKDLSDATRF